MTVSRAFADEVTLDGDYLKVRGQSDIVAACDLVSRHVVIGQHGQFTEDVIPALVPMEEELPAPEPPAATEWSATVPSEGFSPGAASAIGTEIYAIADGVTPGLPLLMTISWSQTVTIQTA